jgi:hypothetical protein
MKVLGVDPGGTTGWLLAEPPHRLLAHGQEHFEVAADAVRLLDGLDRHEDWLVVEEYRVRPAVAHQVQDLFPHELVSVLVAAWPKERLSLQQPSMKHAVGDRMLRRLGLWVPLPHARDAARHVAWFLLRNGLCDPAEAMAVASSNRRRRSSRRS